ncbi:2'-5' RNA ligase family protein [Kribbella sp. DT2]|uniref:2'-5' RNA ligase family protein n=1 Tax=Kribbella sp. DT2 TaxID=3393427 RepID=UPI003CEC9C5C
MSGLSPAYPRCFVAVAPCESLSVAQHCRLSGDVPVALDWAEPAVLHVTLAFLGWLTAERCDVVRKVVGRVETKPPARLTLTGRARVVGAEETRSLVAEVAPDPALMDYRSAVAEALAAQFGSVAPADRYWPHVTIAKVAPGPLPADEAWVVDRISFAVSSARLCAGRTLWIEPPEPPPDEDQAR